MKMIRKSIAKYANGFTLSLIMVSLFNALLVIAKESNNALKEWMKVATGHHWTTHGVVVLIMFIALGLVLSNTNIVERLDVRKALVAVLMVTIISGFIITGFFWTHI